MPTLKFLRSFAHDANQAEIMESFKVVIRPNYRVLAVRPARGLFAARIGMARVLRVMEIAE